MSPSSSLVLLLLLQYFAQLRLAVAWHSVTPTGVPCLTACIQPAAAPMDLHEVLYSAFIVCCSMFA
jgi:hypothetical protein